MNLVEKAREFAEFYHEGQLYNGKPYIEAHLDEVVKTVRIFTSDPVVLAIAYLHDILEDTSCLYAQLEPAFGKTIAKSVKLLTDGNGQTRYERQLFTYSRLTKDENATLVKICDRLTNMKASYGTKHALTYVNEYERFEGTLFKEEHDLALAWRFIRAEYVALKNHMKNNPDTYIYLKDL